MNANKNYKSFSLPGGGVLRINKDKIVATISSATNNTIEIYCSDTAIPFRVEATKHTPQQIIDCIWENHDLDGGM